VLTSAVVPVDVDHAVYAASVTLVLHALNALLNGRALLLPLRGVALFLAADELDEAVVDDEVLPAPEPVHGLVGQGGVEVCRGCYVVVPDAAGLGPIWCRVEVDEVATDSVAGVLPVV